MNLEGRELPAIVLTEELSERWNDVLQKHWEYSTWMNKIVQLKEASEDLRTDLWKKALGPEKAATLLEENQAIVDAIILRRDALLVSMQPDTEFIFGDMRTNLRKYGLYQEGDLFWRRVTGSFGETDTWLDPPILGKEEALIVLKDWNTIWRQTNEGYTESEWEEWEREQEGRQEGGEGEGEGDYLAGSFT